ncbi:MAG: DNA mismatch endonuclease Vsr [Phycisphaeraceae bacterium]|nr:DNA mismatch endonuclease Vsr [Phycisphaeraceae bacterium]
MRAVRSTNTTPERIVRTALLGLGCRCSRSESRLQGRPDIVIPSLDAVVFVHGCFWHGHSCRRGKRRPVTNAAYWEGKIAMNKQRDRRVVRALRSDGWRVLVVWECQTRRADCLAERLSAFLEE